MSRMRGKFSFLGSMLKGMLGQNHPPEFAKAFAGFKSLEELIEGLKNRETARAMTKFMRIQAPDMMEVLLDERDVILADSLRNTNGKTILGTLLIRYLPLAYSTIPNKGVVGLAHLDGIEKHLKPAKDSIADAEVV